MGVPAGAYCPAFSSRWASAAEVRRGSTCTDSGRVHVQLERVVLQRVLHLLDGRVDDVGRMHPFPLGIDGAGLDARHVDDVLEQPVEARDFESDDVELIAPQFVAGPGARAGCRPPR